MAKVFLSYDRDDVARARPIAAQLERAGHSVWWDRQIKGGREFGAEIEAALDDADKIIVLWSERAVKSAWVRDEAAVGRDTGRLVPATLDGTPPPLGFRQFQTIDLSKTRGHAGSLQLEQVVEAIGAAEPLTPRAPKPTHARSMPRRQRLLGAFAMLGVTASAVGGVWWWRSVGSLNEPRIAIASVDGSPLSREVARDLAVRLPDLPGADTGSYELIDASQSASPKADVVMTVGAGSGAGRERRDLALRTSNNAILWSTSVDQPSQDSTRLPQQLAVQAQRAIACAAEALSYRRERLRQSTLKIYLTGCTSFDQAYGANLDKSAQVKLFEDVIAQAPHFEPAWAKLFISEVDNFGSVDDPVAWRRKIAAHVSQAQRLGLDFGELYVAKAATLSPADFVGIFRVFDEGLKHHPGSAVLHRERGERSLFVGRMNDAVGDCAQAVEIDPMSPANQQTLASAYAYAGNTDAAYAQLRKAEVLWPSSPTVISARYRLDLRYGDPKEALALLQDPTQQGPLQSEQAAFIMARLKPTPENIEGAIAEDRKIYQQYPDFVAQIVQTLAQFGRKDEVIDILLHYSGGEAGGVAAEVLFRPAMRDVWRDPRSMGAAARLGLLHYWKASGRWPDFCTDAKLPYDCKQEAAKYRV